MDVTDCAQAEELFSDHLEGTLPGPSRQGLERHLARCPRCAELREAFAAVVEALEAPELEPAADLAGRAAAAALRARTVVPLLPRRSWREALQSAGRLGAADSLALVRNVAALLTVGTTVALFAGQLMMGRPPRSATRIKEQTINAGVYLAERKERLVEDFKILRVVIATAFEGRLDRMNDRVDDYRQLLERHRGDRPAEPPGTAPAPAPGSGSGTAAPPDRGARVAWGREAQDTLARRSL